MLSKNTATNISKNLRKNLRALFYHCRNRFLSSISILLLTIVFFYFLLSTPDPVDPNIVTVKNLRWTLLNNEEIVCPTALNTGFFYEYQNDDTSLEFYVGKDKQIYLSVSSLDYIKSHPNATTCEPILSPSNIEEIL